MESTQEPLSAALQDAYLLHLMRPGSKRLPWLEAAIDRAKRPERVVQTVSTLCATGLVYANRQASACGSLNGFGKEARKHERNQTRKGNPGG